MDKQKYDVMRVNKISLSIIHTQPVGIAIGNQSAVNLS